MSRSKLSFPALVLVVGCATEPDPPASVEIIPGSDTVEVGRQVTLRAVATDATDAILTGRLFDWESSDPTVATVVAMAGAEDSAAVTGVAPGTVAISAIASGVSTTASIAVIPTLPPVTGVWRGAGSGQGVSLVFDITLEETALGTITGSGDISYQGEPLDGFSASGIRSASSIEIGMLVSGFQPFRFAGVYTGASMSGRIDGSGFDNFQTVLNRVTTPAARQGVAGPAAATLSGVR